MNQSTNSHKTSRAETKNHETLRSNIHLKSLYTLFVTATFVFCLNAHAISDCMSPSRKEDTMSKYKAIQRAALCESANDFSECSEYLGLGAASGLLAAKYGLEASKKIRNPDFNICPLKTAMNNYKSPNIIVLAMAVTSEAYAAKCIPPDLLKKQYLTNTIERGIADIDSMILQQEKAIKAFKTDGKQNHMLQLEAEKDQALDNIHKAEGKSTLTNKIEAFASENDLLRNELKKEIAANGIDSIRANEIRIQRIKNSKLLTEFGKKRASEPAVLAAEKKFQEAVTAHRAAWDAPKNIESSAPAKPYKPEVLESMQKNLAELKKSKLDFERLQNKIVNADSRVLNEISASIKTMPLTSENYISKLRHVAFFADATAQDLRHTESSSLNHILARSKKLAVKLPVVGSAIAAVGFVTSANADEFLADNLSVGSTACTGMHPYFDEIEKDGSCETQYTFNEKSSKFFTATSADQAEALLNKSASNGEFCKLIENSYSKFYGRVTQVYCGSKIELTTIDGRVNFEANKFPPEVKLPEGMEDYKVAALEASACCNQTDIRPTDKECAQYNIRYSDYQNMLKSKSTKTMSGTK